MSLRETPRQKAARKAVRNKRIKHYALKATPLNSKKTKQQLRTAKAARRRAG